MDDIETLSKNSLDRHMTDDPCVVCGEAGHDAWGNCEKLSSPVSTLAPIFKIYGKEKALQARKVIEKYRKEGKAAHIPKPMVIIESPEPGHVADADAKAAKDQADRDAKAENQLLNDCIASAPTTIDGLGRVRDATQAEAVETVVTDAARISESSSMGNGNAFKPTPAISKATRANYPLRKHYAKPTSEVFTNHYEVHYEVNFKPNTRFFVYEILKMLTGKTKKKTRFILKAAINAWQFTKDHMQHLTTDCVKTIVAWKDLHSSTDYARIVDGDPTTRIGAIWMPEAIADGKDRIQLFIKLHRELDLEGLKAYIDANHTRSDPDFNFQPIVDALNIAVTTSLSDSVFQQSTNKFFVKCGHQRLTGNTNLRSLCTIRGYYYTIKPAMQKVMLNVNTATSAFFCPITVDEYLNDTTFTEDEAIRLLKTLKVYIVPDRKPAANPDNQSHTKHLNKPQNQINSFFNFSPPLNNRTMTFHKTFKDAQGQ